MNKPNNNAPGRINILQQKPYYTFLLISFICSILGMFLDLMGYISAGYSSLLIVNAVTIILIIATFVCLLFKKLSIRTSANILLYALLLNIVTSNIYMQINEIPEWELNLLRDVFIIAVFVIIAALMLGKTHVLIVNGVFLVFVVGSWLLAEPGFFTENVLFIVMMMSGFSYGVIVFMDRLKYSLKQNQELHGVVIDKNKEITDKEAELARERTLRLEEVINSKNRELVSNTMFLAQSSESNIQLSKKLEEFKVHLNTAAKEKLTVILSGNNLLGDTAHWGEFQKRFEAVHPGFYQNITRAHNGLTPTELKLSAFVKLGLSSKEISLLTCNTEKSVEVARSRLRKKMGIPKSENLATFLSGF